MSTIKIILTILQLLSGLAVTVVVLMQSGKSAGLSGAIAGGAETFLSKGKAKSLDAKLAKATKWFAEVCQLTLVRFPGLKALGRPSWLLQQLCSSYAA